MGKILISLSVLFLILSALFGVLNTSKARNLRDVADRTATERVQMEQGRAAKEKELQSREAAVAAAAAKNAETIGNAEADLVKTQQERADLQNNLKQKEQEIAALQKRLDEAGAGKEVSPDALPMPGAGDLQTQLEETRRQLDSAEREKQLLTDKIRSSDRKVGGGEGPHPRAAAPHRPGLRGTVLAVNQAYNFVVLNLGGRQGVEANSEMLILRGGTTIGKIRVSSVEPATAIGDIITSSLPRGVQVQPGDIVIYAGNNS
jgi:multidrug efflux pump subunit AcrA (membrane-fusion protein)